jgi:hypothetical protein
MARDGEPIAERAVSQLPGWLFLLTGLTLIALAVLTPAWLACREARHRHAVIEARAEAVARETDRYRQFHTALKARDPLLLERLAYAQLRMKPADARLARPVPGGGEATARQPAAPAMIPIADWLDVPTPRVGEQLDPYEPMNTRLTRLATGTSRWAMLAAGLCCAAGGLLAGAGRSDQR